MMKSRWTLVLGAVVLAGAAYGMGRMQSSSSEGAVSGAVAAAPPIVVERTVREAGGERMDRDELRALVREELERGREAAKGEREEEVVDPEKAARLAEAASAATAAVQSGIADGIWDEKDRAVLREQLPHLGERETREVLLPLFQAVNAQRVKLDGPPF